MNIIKTSASAVLAIAVLALSAPAASAQIEANLGAGVVTQIDVGTTSSAATSTVGTGTTATGAITVDLGDEGIIVTRSDVSSSATVMNAISVSTSADLETYAAAFISNDENVTRIEADGKEVSVWYKQPAKLLGFIPVSVSAEGSVNADGSVDVSYPWYSFLATYDDARLESNLDLAAGSIARAEASSEFSASVQARLIESIRMVMKAHAAASASADVDTSSQIEVR